MGVQRRTGEKMSIYIKKSKTKLDLKNKIYSIEYSTDIEEEFIEMTKLIDKFIGNCNNDANNK